MVIHQYRNNLLLCSMEVVAQLEERSTANREVVSSSLTPSKKNNVLHCNMEVVV